MVVMRMMVMSVVALLGVGTVVGTVVGTARSEPVRWLALDGIFGHGVGLVLVAGLAHGGLYAIDAIGDDVLPFA